MAESLTTAANSSELLRTSTRLGRRRRGVMSAVEGTATARWEDMLLVMEVLFDASSSSGGDSSVGDTGVNKIYRDVHKSG